MDQHEFHSSTQKTFQSNFLSNLNLKLINIKINFRWPNWLDGSKNNPDDQWKRGFDLKEIQVNIF